ncbi:hypothetical protein [Xanthomarina spongicola]|uniref:Uncharacterized protein n=1 Tax=Xanthomarina spongicola TaxID=570520 RepID=A0A316DM20_9FLAO|nr:hypothetical protein [Xanthomarina spongicola]PWK17783.1 hypothetical protein LX78_02574 [Xanthomarina spongicola]
MIKFFRKIRQGLISDNKFSKYLLYAIGEIVLVVIGIFIALQLNLWSENRKLDDVRQGYYHQLLDDLNKDKVYIEQTIADIDSFRLDYNNYIEIFKEPNLNTDQVLANLFSVEIMSLVIGFNTSTIETLENTGDIKLVPPHIRNKLAELKRSQDFIVKVSYGNDNNKNNILEEASLLIGSSTLSERLVNQPDLTEFIKSELNYPKLFLVMEAMHEWKKSSEEITLKSLKDLLKDNSEIQELITKELKD